MYTCSSGDGKLDIIALSTNGPVVWYKQGNRFDDDDEWEKHLITFVKEPVAAEAVDVNKDGEEEEG